MKNKIVYTIKKIIEYLNDSIVKISLCPCIPSDELIKFVKNIVKMISKKTVIPEFNVFFFKFLYLIELYYTLLVEC